MKITLSAFVLRSVAIAALACASSVFALDALHVRDGWPHAATRASTAHELRVAFLGGSITAAADGWRTLTVERLRALLPGTKIVEIAAGVPGTGSDLGACRVGRDVVAHRPDVVFVEFAVNDAARPDRADDRRHRAPGETRKPRRRSLLRLHDLDARSSRPARRRQHRAFRQFA